MTDNETNQFWRDVNEHKRSVKEARFKTALSLLSVATQFCADNGYVLALHNENYHWHFIRGNQKYSWYPSTGTFSLDGEPNSRICLTTLKEVMKELKEHSL